MKRLIVCSVIDQRPLSKEAILRMTQVVLVRSVESNCHVINDDELSREGGIPGQGACHYAKDSGNFGRNSNGNTGSPHIWLEYE